MTFEELKIRRLANQHLIERSDCKTVLHDLCGVQAQFLSNAMHALKIRCHDHERFETDSLIKSWTLRGTMHIFSAEDLPLFLHEGRSHYLRPSDTLDEDEFIGRERKAYFAGLIIKSVADGVDERESLREICRQNGISDREELRSALIANASAFDDSGEMISVSVDFPEQIDSIGSYDVRYYASDSSGNTSEVYGRLRITSIYDPIVYLGDVKVDRDDGIYLSEGDIASILVNSAGIKFDIYLVAGRKTAAQIKGEKALHTDALSGELTLGELSSGIYTVLIVTEQRDYFRFYISVSKEEPTS